MRCIFYAISFPLCANNVFCEEWCQYSAWEFVQAAGTAEKALLFFSHLTDHRTERKRNSQRRHLVIFFVVLAIDQIFYTVDFVPVMKVAYENDNHFLFCVSLKVVISFLIIAGEGNY